MRMRKKPNLVPRMERASACLINEPQVLRGKWLQSIEGFSDVHIELGCGKGRFTCELARLHPDTLIIGIERVPDALVVAMERAMSKELPNVRFIANDAVILPEMFAEEEVSRIYINFCDPWPGKKRAKRRLTSDGFLGVYRKVLKKDGEIHFKTDNNNLFEYSLESFLRCGYSLSEITRDLHGLDTPDRAPNAGELGIMTNYEEKFHAEGVKINRLVAVNTDGPQ